MVLSVVGGGFDGKGMGVIAADSSGAVLAAPPHTPPAVVFSCKARLADEELHELARAVSSAREQEWAREYVHAQNPDGCCDQLAYALELHKRLAGGGEQVYAATWYEGSAPLLPKDLGTLQEAVSRLRKKVLDNCEGTPNAR
jgi:hypothetical protein